jgi:hypothetical protein
MRELRERAEPILKVVCVILAALVVYQLAGIFVRWNPFRGVTVPALPALTSGTNSPAGGVHATNLAATAMVKGTNNTPRPVETNVVPRLETQLSGTSSAASTNAVGTNLLSAAAAAGTNPVPAAAGANTNSTAHVELATTKSNADTNVVARVKTKLSGTNSAPTTNALDKGTNVLPASTAAGTNADRSPKPEEKGTNAAPAPQMTGMNLNQPPGKSGAELPPAVKSRISRITDSEILGPVIRPLPMALLGIAGEFAFLRSASGQTGLVKEGDSLGDLKLLRIGINRVLVEQDGQKKELMIFSGYGGESLLPTNTPDENKHP